MSGREASRVRKWATYAAGSGIAAVCSEATLVLCYGLIGISPQVSSVIAWFAGAIPNYWLNRSWTWQQRGRPSFRREVLPYVLIVLLTLVVAMLATHGVDRLLADSDHTVRTVTVAATFFGVYVLMFLVRFFLFDRLFARTPSEVSA